VDSKADQVQQAQYKRLPVSATTGHHQVSKLVYKVFQKELCNYIPNVTVTIHGYFVRLYV
jgi:hypothetical protein